MDAKCKNCKHWDSTGPNNYWHQVDKEELEMRRITGFSVGLCKGIPEFVRPAFSDKASVHDGSEYMASLMSGPDFFCAMFEPNEPVGSE